MLTVYSKTECPFCDRAKSLLTLKNIKFVEINIDQDPDAKQYIIAEGHRTVPQIYKDGTLFVNGGFNALIKLDDSVFQQLRESQDAN